MNEGVKALTHCAQTWLILRLVAHTSSLMHCHLCHVFYTWSLTPRHLHLVFECAFGAQDPAQASKIGQHAASSAEHYDPQCWVGPFPF